MKVIFVLLSLVSASSLFGETWYGYCAAELNDFRYCTRAEIKLDDMEAKCKAFADGLGSRAYKVYSGTDLLVLESEMSAHCDSIKGPDTGAIYSCLYVRQCAQSASKIFPMGSRVYTNSKAEAIDRCAMENTAKVIQKLKAASLSNCYFKLAAELTN